MNKILAILFFILLHGEINAQVQPAENSKLNYRLIGFRFLPKQGVNKYRIEIAVGTFKREDSFQKHIITSLSSTENKMIGEVPCFGKQYTWRVVYIDKKTAKTKSGLHHFSTLNCPEIDPNINRLRVIQPAKKYKDAYVFLDVTRALYDMNGKPVWFLPNIDRSTPCPLLPAQDLKLSPFGTITYMYKDVLYEISYDGAILWSSPGNSAQENKRNDYHHEFTMLSNGHYMVLKREMMLCKANAQKDSSYLFPYSDSLYTLHKKDTNYHIFPSGTLVEYDKNGNIVWTWSALKYINESDLFYAIKNGTISADLYDNAFFFDEKNKSVYISFRNINRVIKVKYPEGNVLQTYGEIYLPGLVQKGNKLFCGQHSCRWSDSGYLYLFNNNSDEPDSLSSIVILQYPIRPGDTLNKIWEYKIAPQDIGITEPKPQGNEGGNVIELPDQSMFASMGYYAGAVFIVNKDKKITWSAIPERLNLVSRQWDSYVLGYRASIILNKKQLERLIWAQAGDKR